MHASALQRSTPWKQSATYYYLLLPKVCLQIHTRNPDTLKQHSLNLWTMQVVVPFQGTLKYRVLEGDPHPLKLRLFGCISKGFPTPRFAAVLNTMHPNPPEATSLAVGKCRFATCGFMFKHMILILNNWIWSAVALKPICFTGTTA